MWFDVTAKLVFTVTEPAAGRVAEPLADLLAVLLIIVGIFSSPAKQYSGIAMQHATGVLVHPEVKGLNCRCRIPDVS